MTVFVAICSASLRRRVSCFPLQLLREGAAQQTALESPGAIKDERRNKNNEYDQTSGKHTTAGHELRRCLTPARPSAHLESQRWEEDFHVLESDPDLSSQSRVSFRVADNHRIFHQMVATIGSSCGV
jgi:hypothetical protein